MWDIILGGLNLLQVATLEQQVANLERQRQQEASGLRASSEHMQREMQGHCTNLQAQLDAFQVCLCAAMPSCFAMQPLPVTAQLVPAQSSPVPPNPSPLAINGPAL